MNVIIFDNRNTDLLFSDGSYMVKAEDGGIIAQGVNCAHEDRSADAIAIMVNSLVKRGVLTVVKVHKPKRK